MKTSSSVLKKTRIYGAGITVFSILIILFVFFQLTRQQPKNIPQEVVSQSPTSVPPSPIQQLFKKASFAVFTNGLKRDFSASMYHNLSKDVYIEASNSAVVNVKKSGITWQQFFNTLPMKVTNQCLTTGTGETFCTGETGRLSFYLNGLQVDDLLERSIENGDRALITFGVESSEQIMQQFSQIESPGL